MDRTVTLLALQKEADLWRKVVAQYEKVFSHLVS